MTDTSPDSLSFSQLVTNMQTLLSQWYSLLAMEQVWASGTASGGYHSDGTASNGPNDTNAGYYPLPTANNGIVYQPCPAKQLVVVGTYSLIENNNIAEFGRYIPDNSSGAVSITLPSLSSTTSTVEIMDGLGLANVNTITINPNGTDTIYGTQTNNIIMDKARGKISLSPIIVNSVKTWALGVE